MQLTSIVITETVSQYYDMSTYHVFFDMFSIYHKWIRVLNKWNLKKY